MNSLEVTIKAVYLPKNVNKDMKRQSRSLLSLLIIVLLTGCSASKMTLFSESQQAGSYSVDRMPDFKIEAGDGVSIVFYGQDSETVKPFNLTEANHTTDEDGNVYTVGQDGSVILPVIGRQELAGKTVREAEKTLETAVSQHLREPMVRVKIRNAQVTVIGEVDKPGTFTIEKPITLLAALGKAGDLLPNARRDNVLIQRQENGKVKQYRVNLLTDELFASPCYYLQKGDVVYVSPRYKSSRR